MFKTSFVRAVGALVLGASCALAAHAEQCYEYQGTSNGGMNTGWLPSASAVCSAAVAWFTSQTPDRRYSLQTCPAQSGEGVLLVNGEFTVSFSVTPRPIDCVVECKVGAPNELNVTVGYSRTPGGADGKMAVVVSRPWEGGNVCFAGCRHAYGEPVRAWWDNVGTSSGLYRGSMDMKVTGLGATCDDASDPAISQATPGGPDCPGFVGEVNGKPVCAGTAQDPTRNDEDINSPLPSNTGNPPTGNVGAGGSGPGRTPTTGSGGPEGGPGGTGSSLTPGGGGSGSGTVKTPEPGEEQAACGAPGQPACRIDETGTPNGRGAMDGAGSQLDASQTGFLDAITAAKEITAPEWTWTFQLPTACGPIDLGAFDMSIDICQWQPMIHDLLSIAWIAATIWFSIGLVGRTLGGS